MTATPPDMPEPVAGPPAGQEPPDAGPGASGADVGGVAAGTGDLMAVEAIPDRADAGGPTDAAGPVGARGPTDPGGPLDAAGLADAAGPSGPSPARARRQANPLLAIAETVVITIVVFALTQAFVARTYAVQQTSMQQTLEPGERIFVDELTPRFDPYKRGDIVVFTAPAEAGAPEPLVKRVIGVGGDTVQLIGGRVVVNGTALVEPYVYGSEGTLPFGDQYSWTVPAGYLFVLGDHREVSRDSREFGPVPVTSVIGRAWLRFYPIDTFGLLAGH